MKHYSKNSLNVSSLNFRVLGRRKKKSVNQVNFLRVTCRNTLKSPPRGFDDWIRKKKKKLFSDKQNERFLGITRTPQSICESS